MQATIERDGAGLARAIAVNGKRLLAQRDGAGQLIGVISDDLVSKVLRRQTRHTEGMTMQVFFSDQDPRSEAAALIEALSAWLVEKLDQPSHGKLQVWRQRYFAYGACRAG